MANSDLIKQLNSNEYDYIQVQTYRSYKIYGKDYYCDVCVVKDKVKDRTFVRLQKRWFGISKKMAGEGITEPKWIIINSYNFPQEFEFKRVKKLFDNIYDNKKMDGQMLDNTESIVVSEFNKLKVKIEALNKQKNKDKKTKTQINELRDQLSFLDQENKAMKKKLLKAQLPDYKKIVTDAFTDLDGKGESHFQTLFTKNKWIFGPSYEEVIPKRKADTKNQPDFVLKRYDGFSDVVEIESPSKPLFTKQDKSGKSQPTSLLMQAVTQAMDYIESYNQAYKDLFYEDSQNQVINPIHAYYPRGFVVIGTDSRTDRKKLRQLNNFLHNITVMTYDEFLKQSERMLEMISK